MSRTLELEVPQSPTLSTTYLMHVSEEHRAPEPSAEDEAGEAGRLEVH